MAQLVQAVTGIGNLTLNGVAAGNALVYVLSYYRNPSTGAAPSAPADDNGTFSASLTPTPLLWDPGTGNKDLGIAIWHQENAPAGIHNVTLPAGLSSQHATLMEWSGLVTSGMLDVSASAQAADAGTSQVTGTTAPTALADELSIIALVMGAAGGSADVGFIDPVVNYTTRQKVPNDASDLAMFHASRILTASGVQSATFNWTYSEANQGRQAGIVTFKAPSSIPLRRIADVAPTQRMG